VGGAHAGDWEAVVGSTDRHGRRRSVRALLGAAALVAGACGPEPFVEDGTAFGSSSSFPVEAGTHAIAWSAWDGLPPLDGCLFGLILSPDDPPQTTDPGEVAFRPPKLAYHVLDAGAALNGQAILELPSGRYHFVVEGSCFWSLRLDRH
jgi:hypothetical protein